MRYQNIWLHQICLCSLRILKGCRLLSLKRSLSRFRCFVRRSGVPSLFGKHEHLLIKPRSASSITEAVKGYLEGGNWQEAIAEELYQTVHEDYDAFKNAGKLLDVYGDVVKNKN